MVPIKKGLIIKSGILNLKQKNSIKVYMRGRKRWEAVGRHMQRWEEMGAGGEAQAAVGRDGEAQLAVRSDGRR